MRWGRGAGKGGIVGQCRAPAGRASWRRDADRRRARSAACRRHSCAARAAAARRAAAPMGLAAWMRSPTRFTSASITSGVLRREDVMSLAKRRQQNRKARGVDAGRAASSTRPQQPCCRKLAAHTSAALRSCGDSGLERSPVPWQPLSGEVPLPWLHGSPGTHWRSSSAVPLAAARLPSMRRSVSCRQNASTLSFSVCDAMLPPLLPLLLGISCLSSGGVRGVG